MAFRFVAHHMNTNASAVSGQRSVPSRNKEPKGKSVSHCRTVGSGHISDGSAIASMGSEKHREGWVTKSHRETDRAVRVVHKVVWSSGRQTPNQMEHDPSRADLQEQQPDQDLGN